MSELEGPRSGHRTRSIRRSVLGCFGSVVFAGPPPASVSVTGGEPTVLNEDAWSPSWSGLRTVGASLWRVLRLNELSGPPPTSGFLQGRSAYEIDPLDRLDYVELGFKPNLCDRATWRWAGICGARCPSRAPAQLR